jgi:uncharacterized membrane protein YwaF
MEGSCSTGQSPQWAVVSFVYWNSLPMHLCPFTVVDTHVILLLRMCPLFRPSLLYAKHGSMSALLCWVLKNTCNLNAFTERERPVVADV